MGVDDSGVMCVKYEGDDEMGSLGVDPAFDKGGESLNEDGVDLLVVSGGGVKSGGDWDSNWGGCARVVSVWDRGGKEELNEVVMTRVGVRWHGHRDQVRWWKELSRFVRREGGGVDGDQGNGLRWEGMREGGK